MIPQKLPESTRTVFPGMRAGEARIMRQWLTLHESEYDRFEYNVRIGAARDPGPDYPDWVRKSAVLCSQRRMDAAAWKGNQVTLLELKNTAFPSAAQQLATYGAVWWYDNHQLPRPRLLLVCRTAFPDTWVTASAANVDVEVLGNT